MVRRAAVLGLAGVLVAAAGCRNACGDRGLLTGFHRGSAPGSLTGRPVEVCADPVGPGIPVSGGAIGPGFGGTLMPRPGLGAEELLPPPVGSNIPPVAVPAQPFAAPADPMMGTLPAPKVGVPVKGGN